MIDMQVRVLGRVEIVGTRERLPPQLARILAVLAAAGRGKEVSSGVLTNALWPDGSPHPPLHTPVSKLRDALTPVGLTVSENRGDRGYRLESLPGGVDVTDVVDRYRFQALVDEAEHLIRHDHIALALDRLRQAAKMWHGPPYSVGSDAEEEDRLPIICREARRALETQQEKLAKN